MSEILLSAKLKNHELQHHSKWRQGNRRLHWLKYSVIFVLMMLMGRMCMFHKSQERHSYASLHNAHALMRPDVVDRHGILLASSLQTSSVYVNPQHVLHASETARALQRIFPKLKFDFLRQVLQRPSTFLWIARHISPDKVDALLREGLPGVYLTPDVQRIYPYGRLTSHVLGFVNQDQKGVSGVETVIDAQHDASLNQTHDDQNAQRKTVELALDMRVQHILYEELSLACQKYRAEAAFSLVIHVPTGEIHGMVSLPDFNPHGTHNPKHEAYFDHNIRGLYEFGSVLKIHNLAMALDQCHDNLWMSFDVRQPLSMGRFRIRDYYSKTVLTFRDAFIYSSNIANARMAMRLGSDRQQKFFKRAGLLDGLHNDDLYANIAPKIPSKWSDITVAALSYGYGISLTPFHFMQSVSNIVRGGDFQELRIFRPKHSSACIAHKENGYVASSQRVISQKTARIIRDVLFQTLRQYPGELKDLAAYDLGGKTGTANLRLNGRYISGRNLTSFVSIYPTRKPQYIMLVSFKNPKQALGSYLPTTARWNATPASLNVWRRLFGLWGVRPDFNAHDGRGEHAPKGKVHVAAIRTRQ